MARVTVEDCIQKIDNRFELIVAASQRAREISNGVPIEVNRDNDKNPVVSLREIADGLIEPADLQERFIRSLQKVNPVSEDEDDIEEEFSTYLSNENASSDFKESSPSPSNSNRGEEDHFEDVSPDVIKTEE